MQRELDIDALSRSVVANQLLFTAGYSLTSTGFLYYFAADLGASTTTMSWLLALPELMGILAIFTPLTLTWAKNKKNLLIVTSIMSRGALLLVPLVAFLDDDAPRMAILICGLAFSGILQAIAYTAYLSWLSDLAPERKWGRFFARRDMAKAAILILLPLLVALFRDYLRNEAIEKSQLWGYVLAFGCGNLLQVCALLPLLKWPGEYIRVLESSSEQIVAEAEAWPVSFRAYLILLAFSWWLAFFQGLTQTAFFLHQYTVLKLSLTQYYGLAGLMYGLQIMTAWLAGRTGDRWGDRRVLMLSTWGVGCSLIFWLASLTGDWIWLLPAYCLWGGFGAVNLSLQNLTLRLIPRYQNTRPFAVVRYGSGLIAGLTGIAGGYWLSQMQQHGTTWQLLGYTAGPFFLLFALSGVGRLLAPCWLLFIDDEPTGLSDK